MIFLSILAQEQTTRERRRNFVTSGINASNFHNLKIFAFLSILAKAKKDTKTTTQFRYIWDEKSKNVTFDF